MVSTHGNWALVLRSERCQLGDLHSSKGVAPADGITQPDTESWALEAACAHLGPGTNALLVSDSSLQKVSAHSEKKNKTGEVDGKRKDAAGNTSSFATSNRGGCPGRHNNFLLACSLRRFIARRSHRMHHFVLICFLNEAFLQHFLLT